LASAGWDRVVKIWDAQTGRTVHSLRLNNTGWGVAFSRDGRRIAAASEDGGVTVWYVESGKEALTFRGHKTGVLSVAFSPDGRRIASSGDDLTVKLWDANTAQEALTLRGHTETIWQVAFNPKGNLLASASRDRTVRIWDATPSK